jgi:hypothetical protein
LSEGQPLEVPSTGLIFKYALCFNGYDAYGGLEGLGAMANDRRFFFSEHGLWVGSARELRGCLFFEARRWRHFGYSPEGADLQGIVQLFERIQHLIREGDLAPNDGAEVSTHGVPAVVVDGVAVRLLEWGRADGLVLTVAVDSTGEVVKRRCPPALIAPDDPTLLDQVDWLFASGNDS